MKNYFITILGLLLLSSCASEWKHANIETGNMYKLKKGKTYQTVRNIYIGKQSPRVLYRELSDGQKLSDYHTLPPGSKFKLLRAARRGSYNNGYFHSVYATLILPHEYAGIELNVDELFSDKWKKPVGSRYVIECD
jgi:hypothetical protein